MGSNEVGGQSHKKQESWKEMRSEDGTIPMVGRYYARMLIDLVKFHENPEDPGMQDL